MTGRISYWLRSTLNSYGQVFFSVDIRFTIILLLVTFIDPWAGASGLLSVITGNFVVSWLGLNQDLIKRGDYGFNTLLVGLGLGSYFDPGFPFLILLITAAVITVFVTILISGFLYKYKLPFLSIPFLLAFWLLILASQRFQALGITERGVFILNELYKTGDNWLVGIYHFVNTIRLPNSLEIYFKSLGAIFFQYNLLAGILIAAGLIIYSRIAFLASMVSYYSAFLFYLFIGAELSDLSYSYIGFNYILSGIAIGAFFLVPSFTSFLWAILMIPAMVIISSSLGNLFASFHLGIYSLPFNMVVLTVLYVLGSRTRQKMPEPVPYQWYSPEINLYEYQGNRKIYENFTRPHIGLPFHGTWKVSQGYEGKYTHKQEWKEALDFIITDEHDRSYRNEGMMREDYYCFDKPVVAPAYGEVVYLERNIEDNEIGKSNLNKNWGNCVVIKHSEFLYSLVAHLKYDSLKVKKGDLVQRGQTLGTCGNSGRSPYPHLHFQIQSVAIPGGHTRSYPVDHFYQWINETDKRIMNFEIPCEGDQVSPVTSDQALAAAFDFQPGQILEGTIDGHPIRWEVNVSPANVAFIDSGKARAYFNNDGIFFSFTSYSGNRKDPLFTLYQSLYRVSLSSLKGNKLTEPVPLNMADRSFARKVMDILAPFISLRKAFYELSTQAGNPGEFLLNSSVSVHGTGINKSTKFQIELKNGRIHRIENLNNHQIISFR